jgi:hypothetical protein
MKITKEEAIQATVNLLSSRIKSRCEIVDSISGDFYMSEKIDFKNSYIVYIKKEELVLDGPKQYVVTDKKTGVMNEIIAR